MDLDLSSLDSAIGQLATAIAFTKSELARETAVLEQFKNSTVQCFEFTYELCWRLLKRRLEIGHANPEQIDKLDYKDLIREGAVRGYVQSPELWFNFRRLRNLSSHAYDRSKADEVFSAAPDLLREARYLSKAIAGS